jgi:uncharacterized transporter YbjL
MGEIRPVTLRIFDEKRCKINYFKKIIIYIYIMKFGLLLFVAVLFFLLTPSILVSLPAKGNKYVVAAVHAIIFALIFYFTYNYVARSNILEGMK